MNIVRRFFQKYLSRSARRFIKKTKPYVIGITGSVGKTTMRETVTQTLQSTLKNRVIATAPKNFNGEIGLPLAILGFASYKPYPFSVFVTIRKSLYKAIFARPEYDIIVLEYGIDHPGEMKKMLDVVVPDFSILTPLDSVHAQNFTSADQLAIEKKSLALSTRDCIFFHESLRSYIKASEFHVDVMSYGGSAAEISTLITDRSGNQTKFQVVSNEVPLCTVATSVYEDGIFVNIAVGIIIADIIYTREYQKSLFSDISILTLDYKFSAGRGNIIQGIKNSIIVDHSYNAAPKSMRYAIETFKKIGQTMYPDHKSFYILGDMRELGAVSSVEHLNLVSLIPESAEYVFLIGKEVQVTYKVLLESGIDKDKIMLFESSTDAGKRARDIITQSNEKFIILGKGSQNEIFIEEALKFLLVEDTPQDLLPRQSKDRLQKKKKYYNSI